MLEIILTLSFNLLFLVFALVAWRGYIGINSRLTAMQKHEISPEGFGVPDLIIIKDTPVQIRIGEKSLLVKTLTLELFEGFLRNYLTFIKTYKDMLNGIEFLNLPNIREYKRANESVDLIIKFFNSKAPRERFFKIIKHSLLKDRNCNPQKISFRYFKKRVTAIDVGQIFFSLYHYNIGECVKKKLVAMSEELSANLTTDTGLSNLWKKREQPASNIYKPLFPNSRYYPKELKNSPNGKNPNLEKKREINRLKVRLKKLETG